MTGCVLLSLQLLVQQRQSPFIASRASDDGKHSLATLVMGSLCNGDLASTLGTNLRDLGTTTTNDTSDHVGGNRNILRTNLRGINRLRLLIRREISAIPRSEGRVSAGTIVARGPPEGSRRTRVWGWRRGSSTVAGDGRAAAAGGGKAGGGIVQDGADTSFPIVYTAFSDFPHGGNDRLDAALDLDDSFGGLGEHFLGGDHAGAGDVLDVLDFETASADDGAHEVVGDEEADRGVRVGSRGDGRSIGKRVDWVCEESLGNQAVSLEIKLAHVYYIKVAANAGYERYLPCLHSQEFR
jgi:hypothetical protein